MGYSLNVKPHLKLLRRLALKKVKLAEIKYRSDCMKNPVDEAIKFTKIQAEIAELEKEAANIQTQDSGKKLNAFIAEYCLIIALKRAKKLLKTQCGNCLITRCEKYIDSPPFLCLEFFPDGTKRQFDKFGRDKHNVLIARMLVQNFL